MNSDRDRVAQLFRQACELPEEQRPAFLERECGTDVSLRTEVESLLAHDLDAPTLEATDLLAAPVLREAGAMADLGEDARQDRPTRVGDYRVVRELGAGGFGAVYEAVQESMNRRVALKVLSRHSLLSGSGDQRFEREAWITGRLTHPNIVKVIEHGTSGGLSYYSMELVEGGSLYEVIENMRKDGRDRRCGLEFTSREYTEWAVRQAILAARALEYTHGQGVVHRDIKPMNLLLDGTTHDVRIADFGLAMEQDVSRLTTQGRVLGTLRYMAPEQLKGERDKVDARTDIYALGVTLFELLTLQFPYQGDGFEKYVSEVLTGTPRRLRQINSRVDRDLDTIIGKALETEPADRYSTAGKLADDLDNVLHSRPIVAHPAGLVVRTRKWIRRRPAHAALIATLAVALPLGAFMAYRTALQASGLRQAEIGELVRRINREDRTGDQAKVIDWSSRILELDSDHRTALRSRAVAQYNRSELVDLPAEAERLRRAAFEDLDRLIGLNPDRSGPRRLKAFFLRRFGREAEASEIEASLTGIDHGDDDDLVCEAEIALYEEDYHLAEKLLSEAILIRPRDDAVFNRAFARWKGDRLELAVQDLEYLIRVNPKDIDSRLMIGEIRTDQGRFEEAQQGLQHTLTLAPTDRKALLYDRLAYNSLNWGRELDAAGVPGEALARFRDVEVSALLGLGLDDDLPWLHLNLGASLSERCRLSDPCDASLARRAVEHLRDGLERTTNSEDRGLATSNLCNALLEAGDPDEALAFCREVVRARPQDPLAYYNLAGAHALGGRTDEALDMLRANLGLGDLDWQWLEQDAWFASLHDDPRFHEILAEMRRRALDE